MNEEISLEEEKKGKSERLSAPDLAVKTQETPLDVAPNKLHREATRRIFMSLAREIVECERAFP